MTLTREVFERLAEAGQGKVPAASDDLLEVTKEDMDPYIPFREDYEEAYGETLVYVFENPSGQYATLPKFFAFCRRHAYGPFSGFTHWGPSHPDWNAFWDKAEAEAKQRGYCEQFDEIVAAVGGRKRMRKVQAIIEVPAEENAEPRDHIVVPAGWIILSALFI